jgi:fructokinase
MIQNINELSTGDTVISFGEVLWDLLPDARILGGAPFNFAFRMHELGATALMVSRLGRDVLGETARAYIERTGMDMRLIQSDKTKPTGTVKIEFDTNKIADITVVQDVAYDHIAAEPLLMREAGNAKCICFGSVAQRNGISRSTLYRLLDQAPQALKVYDINLRKDCYTQKVVESALERCDILKLNESELVELGRMFELRATDAHDLCSAICRKWTVQLCLLTVEGQGAFAVSFDGDAWYSPGYVVEVADPLGAGDAFTAGFVTEFLSGASIAKSLNSGNLLGAMVVGQHGATKPISMEDRAQFPMTHSTRAIDDRFLGLTRNEEYLCRL